MKLLKIILRIAMVGVAPVWIPLEICVGFFMMAFYVAFAVYVVCLIALEFTLRWIAGGNIDNINSLYIIRFMNIVDKYDYDKLRVDRFELEGYMSVLRYLKL